jgi:hypothetical protein
MTMRKLALFGSFLVAAAAHASVPHQLTVQGILRDNTGQLESLMVNVTVKVYDAQTLGSQVGATLGPTTVMAQSGLFTLTMPLAGSDVTAMAAAPALWMEVTAGNDTFPRQIVTPQVFALFAGTADQANALSSTCAGCVADAMINTVSASKVQGAVASCTNASTVTNGIYSNMSYADPSWLSSIAASKVSGTVGSATSFTGNLAGDVSGTQSATVVGKIGGATVTGAPIAAGQYLRSGAANSWSPGAILAGDIPSLSATYADLTSTQVVGGSKTFSSMITCSTLGQAGLLLYNGGAVAEWAIGQRSATSHALSFSKVVSATYTDYMVLDPNGNLGLGVSAPTHPLDLASGAFVSATGVWTNASSRTYKEDIRPIGDPLPLLEKVGIYRYRYRADHGDDRRERIGVIAEELPEMVASADHKGAPTGELVALSLAANRALLEKVNRLERETRAQAERLDALERRLDALLTRTR